MVWEASLTGLHQIQKEHLERRRWLVYKSRGRAAAGSLWSHACRRGSPSLVYTFFLP